MPTCCRAYSAPPSCCWHRTRTTLPRSPPAGSAPASATAGWAEAGASARVRHRVRPLRARAWPAGIRCASHAEAQFTTRHDLLVTDEGAPERLAVERGAGDVGMRLVEAGGDHAETPAVGQVQRGAPQERTADDVLVAR